MIEYATWPYDIEQGKHEPDHPFYLEVFGEASPRITPGYAQLPLPEENGSLKQCTNLVPLYEYYWSVGYIDADGKRGPGPRGRNLADTAAEVYLYFPTTGGWRVQELVATIKYLCPGREHASILRDAAHTFATAQPIVEDASKLAARSGLPGVGPIAASTATLLDVIARLKVTSVPPSHGYDWSVQKVTEHPREHCLLQGVKWTIAKKLFVEFGSRLTGSIAVSLIPTKRQPSSDESDHVQLERLPIRAKAIMKLHARYLHLDRGQSFRLPKGEDEFLELEISPCIEERRAWSWHRLQQR